MSIYAGLSLERQHSLTQKLVDEHPLCMKELCSIVKTAWRQIIDNPMAGLPLEEFSISPSVLGQLLHTLIPKQIENAYPNEWRKDEHKADKDVVNILHPRFSFEIKTSSSKRHIYGNRSYTKVGEGTEKSRNGYLLAINFEKCDVYTKERRCPEITRIAFGYLEHSDWRAQKAETGQNATLTTQAYQTKLIQLYCSDDDQQPQLF